MLTWIAGYVARWTGFVEQHTRDLVQWALHALASVVYTVFGNVGKAWSLLHTALQWAHKAADDFAYEVKQKFEEIIHVAIPRILHEIAAALRAAEQLALHYYRLAVAAVQVAEHLAARAVSALQGWVVQHVWDPLVSVTKQLRADLLKWGYYAYQLVTHPDKLAAILLGALIAAAEAAFWRIAPPAGKFALRLLMSQLRQLLALAEAVLSAVL